MMPISVGQLQMALNAEDELKALVELLTQERDTAERISRQYATKAEALSVAILAIRERLPMRHAIPETTIDLSDERDEGDIDPTPFRPTQAGWFTYACLQQAQRALTVDEIAACVAQRSTYSREQVRGALYAATTVFQRVGTSLFQIKREG